MSAPIPIVIPLHHGGGKFRDNSELRFALRSIERHFKDPFEVWIVSRQLPEGFQGLRHLPCEKGLKSALKVSSEAFPDGFFWYYDDCCLLRDITAAEMKVTPACRAWRSAKTTWARSLERIRTRLLKEKCTAKDYSRPHGPYWFDKGMVDEAFHDWPGMAGKFPWESWILSKRKWPSRHGAVKQYYGPFHGPPKEAARYLNYNDKGFTTELRTWLEERFPEQSGFEEVNPDIPSKVDLSIRASAHCIHLPARPRWEKKCIEDMEPVGIDVKLFEGVDGHESHETLMPVNELLFRREFRRKPLPGEIGCYESHVKFARAVRELIPVFPQFPHWWLVLEDDAVAVNVTGAHVHMITTMAEKQGYDVVMLHTGRKNRRGGGICRISDTSGNDVFTHAYLLSEKAASEISGWAMRHPIDLAISKSNKLKVGVLCGDHRFDQRPPRLSEFSIHRERNGLPNRIGSSVSPIAEAFAPFSNQDHRLGCNKLVKHGYGPMYEELLTPIRGTTARMVEIGVCTGASLQGWRRFLGADAKITGLDIDTSLLRYEEEQVILVDACSPSAAAMFEDSSLDVIVDDGSHQLRDQRAAFDNLWSKVKPGGYSSSRTSRTPSDLQSPSPITRSVGGILEQHHEMAA